ncbi:MAG: hypothetical protein D3914_13530 [Candidatus Electrothrix sp. LOE2]|jgi:hypothetical protein|nr:hypothetical protein [Candidatus Electrothrix sp. LOE2]
MKKYNMMFVLTVLAVSCVIWASNSFAASGTHHINVEGLTLDEARAKYGVASGNSHPIIFEVNAESGPQSCGLIFAPGAHNEACPTAKIFYQSSQLIPNHDGTSTIRVDIYYDVNEVAMREIRTDNV